MNDFKRQVLDLLKLWSVQVADPGTMFTLASGEESPFYIDVKRTALSARVHEPLAYLLYDVLAHGEFGAVESVAGVVLGGCHLASIVGLYAALRGQTKLDVVHVRKERRDHGTGKLIEKTLTTPGQRVVLLEDVVTTGGSSIQAAQYLRDDGFDVLGVLAVIDRRTTRTDTLAGMPIRSLYTLDDFADMVPDWDRGVA